MRVRFGFVAMSLDLPDDSPSRTTTLARMRQPPREQAMRRITNIAAQNLEATVRIVRHAADAGIPLYRFSSRLIPFLGHADTEGWDFFRYLGTDFAILGEEVRARGLATSFHPEHAAVVLTADRPEVKAASARALREHARMCEAMGLDDALLVVHLGGAYGDKAEAIRRFVAAVEALPAEVRARLAVENDDRTYTARDALAAAGACGLPVVLDVLHHRCNPCEDTLAQLVGEVLRTWAGRPRPPKFHLSSPRDPRAMRSHADYIAPEDAVALLDAAAAHGADIDVIVEAKAKDHAVLALTEELGRLPGAEREEGGVVRWRS